MDNLSPEQQKDLLFDWRNFWARGKQLPPDDPVWRYWYYEGGRGAGKTRVGSEWSLEEVRQPRARHMIVGATLMDVRETMLEGESGIISCIPPWEDFDYKPSRFMIRFRHGGIIKGFSADKPDRIRGPNVTSAWGDEFAAWRRPEAFSNLRLCLRKGNPRCALTSTPKQTLAVKQLHKRAETHPHLVRITKSSTWENVANLSAEFKEVVGELLGTRLGRQELDGELLEDVEGALWTQKIIDHGRRSSAPDKLTRVGLAVDPAISSNKDSDAHGIVCGGMDATGEPYILGDYSIRGGPTVWIANVKRAIADHGVREIFAERNRGGDLVKLALRNAGITLPIVEVTSRGSKKIRLEPIIPFYERKLIHHVGYHPALEDLMTTWVPGDSDSPDPLDALGILIHKFKNLGVRALNKKPEGW